MTVRSLFFIALAALTSVSFAAEPAPLRVMTYNIRLDLASDGVNAWPNRRGWVAAQVEWLRPDLFGMQEVQPGQKADLAAALPRYRIFGEGRDEQGAGEASPIGYAAQRFEFVEGGQFWLSPTPEVSSKGWDAAYPRIVTWTRLKSRGAPVVLAVNTHWDHIGEIARRESALQIARWLKANARRCEAIVLLGDFNTGLDTEPLRTIVQGMPSLRDSRGLSKSAPFGPAGTFNEFKSAAVNDTAIDHVFVGTGIDVERYAVISQVIDGRVPSDHFPVLVDLTLAPCR